MPRINKLIDLIEAGQQIYISHPDELSFQCGKKWRAHGLTYY